MRFGLKRLSRELVEAFKKFSTCDISDTLGKLDLASGIFGIHPLFSNCPKVVGIAITQRVISYGLSHLLGRMGTDVLKKFQPGDLIMGDESEVLVIPQDKVEKVLKIALEIDEAEKNIIKKVKIGSTLLDARNKFNYHKL